MNVALNKASVRPGFGKAPERPSFDKKSLANTKTSTSTATVSPLKQAATQSVSTATLSNTCRTRAGSSYNFTPGTHVLGVNDFVRDRTRTAAHGEFAALGGQYQLESDMAMTGRATRRLLNRVYGNQAQQMAMLQQMNTMYAQPQMSPVDFITSLSTMINALVDAFKGGGGDKKVSEKGSGTPEVSSNTTVAAMQNAKTSAELNTAIGEANTRLGSIGKSISSAQGELKELKEGLGELKNAATKTAQALKDNKTQISQKQNEVQNNINRESASKMAMNAAQAQVDMLKSQLSSAGSLAKAGIESSLKQAEEQLKLKTQQYEQAVQDRENSQQQLQDLSNQTAGLEAEAQKAKSDYDNSSQNIAQKEKDIQNLQNEQKEIKEGVDAAQTRLTELQQKEEKKA